MNTLKNHLFPLILSLIMLILALLPREIEDSLIFHRQHLIAGEWWRLFSGHLVHLSWQHLLMNIAGLWLIIWLAKNRLTTTEWLVALLSSSLLISLALLFFSNLDWYVGFSGVLHGFLILVAYRLIADKEFEGWWLLLFVLLKIGWEQWQGASPELEQIIDGNVIIDAHLYGAVAGFFIAPLLSQLKRVRYKSD
ncbi:hypothetical protein MNBD_GAMMA18-786 [hydrothermal vent metagenome]|uniref:Peptidase S54 rhomboid domain-containing protein n=1 Tax=hydrothermal vent metagenome TaxID=652676 RepID=A0A3B0YWY1_9ZZZZ